LYMAVGSSLLEMESHSEKVLRDDDDR